jgi:hypothetical protein
MTSWYSVLTYNPINETCTLAPASQQQAGILYDVPIAWWGGNWAAQKRTPLKLTEGVEPGAWGSSEQGPRWGLALPVQQGDLAKVEHMDDDQSSPFITAFLNGIPGTHAPAFVGAEQGESPQGRFDLLLPSGAWARALGDGSWVLSTGPVGGPAAELRLGADGTITLSGAALVIDTPLVTVNGVTTFTAGGQNISGKEIAVIGAPDSRGDTLTGSAQ